MKNKPLIIISGEPYGVFIEIFLKTIKKKKLKKPLILICSKKLFEKQMKRLNYKFKINEVKIDDINMHTENSPEYCEFSNITIPSIYIESPVESKKLSFIISHLSTNIFGISNIKKTRNLLETILSILGV